MRNLYDYIYEKLSLDNISLDNTFDFPVDGTSEEMIDWLENEGFYSIYYTGISKKTFDRRKGHTVYVSNKKIMTLIVFILQIHLRILYQRIIQYLM